MSGVLDSDNLITKKEWQHGSYPAVLFEYDEQHQITKTTKPAGNRIYYTYDGKGNVVTTKSTDSSGGNALQTTYEYETTYNRLTHTTDPAGMVSTFSYDSRGNMVQAKIDDGHLNLTAAYHYDSAHKYRLDYVDDPKGIRTTYEYNGNYQVNKVTRDPSGLAIAVQYTYDDYGNVITTTDANGHDTVYTVNALNQVTQVTNAGGYYTKLYYDASDNLTKTETQNGSGQGSGDFVVTMAYDILDNLTTSTADIDGSHQATTHYYYDHDDKLIRVTDPEGNDAIYGYDDFDLNTTVTLGYGSGADATYTYAYDANFRLTEVDQPLGSSYSTTYAYDHHDRLTKVTNAAGVYVKSVFANQLRTASEVYDSSNALLGKTTYAYDTAHRPTTTEVMAKDKNGTDIGDGWMTSTVVYDANSNVLTTKDEGNHETHFSYDNANRLVLAEDAVGSQVAYVYDANGNVVTKTSSEKQIGGSGSDTFQSRFAYDNLNRLTTSYDPAMGVSGLSREAGF